jgi:lipopolysaccharide export system protein LptA
MDAKGEAGRGLTRALFTGGARYRERGADVDRAANSGTLEVTLKPGLSAIEEARFAHAVRFEEGKLVAQAAAARYDVHKGSLDLSGSEPGAIVPRVVNDQIAVDGTKIDITLEGPRMQAAGMVKSTIQAPKQEGGAKMPSMLKQDQPVSVVAESLAYDGTVSKATYSGAARLFQGDTTIKGDTLMLDQRVGDLAASGHVMTTTTQEHAAKDGKRPQRVQSTATGNDLKYEDTNRRLTYTGGAHLVGPEGDVSASRIELYLNPAGDDVERAEAYAEGSEKMTLREQNRTTTGARLTYTAAQETYVVTGLPALVVDECGRETTGKTLTMVKSTDTIVVDGNQQIRTETKGGNGKCS